MAGVQGYLDMRKLYSLHRQLLRWPTARASILLSVCNDLGKVGVGTRCQTGQKAGQAGTWQSSWCPHVTAMECSQSTPEAMLQKGL